MTVGVRLTACSPYTCTALHRPTVQTVHALYTCTHLAKREQGKNRNIKKLYERKSNLSVKTKQHLQMYVLAADYLEIYIQKVF